MNVYLATSERFPQEWTPLAAMRDLAARDRVGEHTLADAPQDADVILFVDAHLPHDWTLKALRSHPLVARYPEKAFLYDERDRPWCSLPGLYPSMPRSAFDPRRQRAVSYFKDFGDPSEPDHGHPPDLLFSFMGAPTHKCRRSIFRLSHPSAYIENTAHTNFYDFSGNRDEAKIQRQREAYAQVNARSKFILCPRGNGTSSFRLFETMRAGRVPVIISDEWVPPVGPDWPQFSLRVREADIETIPSLLEHREAQFEQMASLAHQAYAEWFAPDVIFHRMSEDCRDLLQGRTRSALWRQWITWRNLRCVLTEARMWGRMRLVATRNQVLRRGAP